MSLSFCGRACNQFVALEGGSVQWTDAHIPRTHTPARFVWLSGVPTYRPRIARTYWQSVRPAFWGGN